MWRTAFWRVTLIALGVFVVCIAIFALFNHSDHPELAQLKQLRDGTATMQKILAAGEPVDPARARQLMPQGAGTVLPPEAGTLARTLNTPDGTAEQDVQTLSSLVELFRRANQGAIPAGGLNEEITEQLLGRNPQHFAVLPPDCPALDAAGRLLDRWGKPYFLHPLSREVLEIRSAGPDGKFGNDDDVVVGDEAGREVRR